MLAWNTLLTHANLDSHYPVLLLEADFFMVDEIVEYKYIDFAHA